MVSHEVRLGVCHEAGPGVSHEVGHGPLGRSWVGFYMS